MAQLKTIDIPVTEALETLLASEILGGLNVGSLAVLAGSRYGLLLEQQTQPTTLVGQTLPILQVPPVPGRFLGRQEEVATAIAAIQAGRSLEISGVPGIGKSAFLRHLAHHPTVTTSHGDGMLYLNRLEPFADVLHELGETFYHLYPDSYLPVGDWQTALQDVQALVIVNAPYCKVESIQTLRSLMPRSTFVVASHRARLTHGDGREVDAVWQQLALGALPWPDSLQLIEQVQDQPIAPLMQPVVEQLWQIFGGEPVRLMQLAELARLSHQQSWADWQAWLASPAASSIRSTNLPSASLQHLVDALVAMLTTPQRWILSLLVALEGASLSLEQIASITGPQEPQSSLQGLVRLGLVRPIAGRYGVPDHMRAWLLSKFDSQPWMLQGLEVMQAWSQQQPPETIVAELSVLMAFLRWAVAQKQSRAVLSLARSIDTALFLGKRWNEWGRVLQWALQAAWQASDVEAEAWAWHELGVRALLLEDVTTAYDSLQQSLRLRRGLDDRAAIALTQRNLSYLMQGTLPAGPKAAITAEQSRRQTYVSLAILSLLTFSLSLGLGLAVKQWLTPEVDGNSSVEASP
jgi:hypothetical protein